MIKTLINIMFMVMFLNLIFLIRKPLRRDEYSIKLSLWGKTFPMVFLSLLILASKYVSIEGRPETGELYKYILFFVVFYLVYAACMFRYVIETQRVVWFNGLYIKSVHRKEICEIRFIGENENVKKFIFITTRGKCVLRNDVNIENLIFLFAQNHGISLKKQTQLR
jgi:hypothetical protein